MIDQSTIDARRQLERDILIQKLGDKLGFDKDEAGEMVALMQNANVLLIDKLQRIDALAGVLGPHTGKVLLQSRPECIAFRLQRLWPRSESLRADGYQHSQVVRILSLCIEITELTGEEFYRTHHQICRLLPVRAQRHAMVNFEQQIYLIPADRLRRVDAQHKEDDPKQFWDALCVSLAQMPESARKRPALSSHSALPSAARNLMDRLTQMGASAASARSMTIKIYNAHGEKSDAVIDAFIAHAWTGFDIACLVRESAHPGWRKNPQVLFDVEEMMISCGLPPKEVRDLLIERHALSEADPLTVRRAITALLETGYGAGQIMQFAKNKPRILFAHPDWIRVWHAANVAEHRHAYSFLHLLLKAPKERRPPPPPKPPRVPKQPPPLIRKPLPAAIAQPAVVHPPIVRVAPATKPPPPASIPVRPRPAPLPPVRKEEDEDDDDGVIPAQHERIWKKEIQTILRLSDETWYAENWAEFEKDSAWMWDRTGPAPAILDHFALWLGMAEIQRRESPAIKFLAHVLRNTEYHSLLRLPPPALQHRLAAIRTIVNLDFLKDTSLLLLRWERVSPVELRYRVHEIEARGKKANRPPYLIMLVEPTREQFLERLQRHA